MPLGLGIFCLRDRPEVLPSDSIVISHCQYSYISSKLAQEANFESIKEELVFLVAVPNFLGSVLLFSLCKH